MMDEWYQGDIIKISGFKKPFMIVSNNAFIHATNVFHCSRNCILLLFANRVYYRCHKFMHMAERKRKFRICVETRQRCLFGRNNLGLN